MVLFSHVNPRIINVQLLSSHKPSYLPFVISNAKLQQKKSNEVNKKNIGSGAKGIYADLNL